MELHTKPMDSKMITIETERLILRPHTVEDIEPSYQMNLDPVVSEYTHDGGVVSFEEIDRRIRENVLAGYEKHGYARFAVDWKKTRQFIGFSGLKYLEDLDEVDLGYRLLRDFWGQGLATESGRASLEFGFNHLGLESIIGQVLKANKASIRVLEKLNFKFEKEFDAEGEPALMYRITKNHFNSAS